MSPCRLSHGVLHTSPLICLFAKSEMDLFCHNYEIWTGFRIVVETNRYVNAGGARV